MVFKQFLDEAISINLIWLHVSMSTSQLRLETVSMEDNTQLG